MPKGKKPGPSVKKPDTYEALRDKGLGTRKGIPVKILAKGEVTKALTVHAHAFSASARAAIEAAGGTCNVVE